MEDALTAVGLAVDGIKDHGAALRPVVLAEVRAVSAHPKRDTLQLVTIRTRMDSTPLVNGSLPPQMRTKQPSGELTVVCGAKNVPAPGGMVVFAGLGVKLPGVDFELSRREIGGVISEGMLCSEAELGLADSADGILVFAPGSFEPGTRLIDAFPEARDVVFELDITPNRPDALGHVGVARDMAAFFECKLQVPTAMEAPEGGAPVEESVVVKNLSPQRCPRYAASVVRGITIEPSPSQMRWRLHRLGIRPISNVVDVTNWILLEFGQPLHAFDASLVRGNQIVIRRAARDEKLKTLDGIERTLTEDDLLICDGEGPTALAGVMGGAESEISSTTQDVLIESAFFTPQGVRRTARRHAIHTESSHRFERGTDHGGTVHAIKRASSMMAQLGGGVVAPGVVSEDGEAPDLPSIEFHSAHLDSLLGVGVPFKEATRILQDLGLKVEYLVDTHRGPVASVRGASHRPDITIEEDLIEEVARIRGLDNIPTILPAIAPQQERIAGQLERDAANVAVELGLSEALLHAFVAPSDLKAVHAPKSVVRLNNPLSSDRSVLRSSLTPGLLEALRRARRRGVHCVQLFSIGAIFLDVHGDFPLSRARVRRASDKGMLPFEQPTFSAVLAGPRPSHLSLKSEEFDVYDAKAVAVEMVQRMTHMSAEVAYLGVTERTAHLHPRGAGCVMVNGVELGVFGPLHPDVIEHFDLDGTAQVIELNLAGVEALGKLSPRYRSIPKLPAITRDLSLVVSDQTEAGRVGASIREAAGELCESVVLAAEFRGGSVPEGHRSLTFRVVYRDPNATIAPEKARTLTDKEIEVVQARALAKASSNYGATLRG